MKKATITKSDFKAFSNTLEEAFACKNFDLVELMVTRAQQWLTDNLAGERDIENVLYVVVSVVEFKKRLARALEGFSTVPVEGTDGMELCPDCKQVLKPDTQIRCDDCYEAYKADSTDDMVIYSYCSECGDELPHADDGICVTCTMSLACTPSEKHTDNPGCDRCGTADREPGSKFCSNCDDEIEFDEIMDRETEDDYNNGPCKTCGLDDLPLHFDRNCPGCFEGDEPLQGRAKMTMHDDVCFPIGYFEQAEGEQMPGGGDVSSDDVKRHKRERLLGYKAPSADWAESHRVIRCIWPNQILTRPIDKDNEYFVFAPAITPLDIYYNRTTYGRTVEDLEAPKQLTVKSCHECVHVSVPPCDFPCDNCYSCHTFKKGVTDNFKPALRC